MTDVKNVYVRNRRDPKGFVMFLNLVQEAVLEGYRVPSVEDMTHQDIIGFMNQFGIRMKFDESSSDIIKTVAQTVEDINTALDSVSAEPDLEILQDKKAQKVDLLALAEELEIEVPDDKKSPMAISKFIREELSKREEDKANNE